MRALIIGCGYVGAALAERLLERGVEVSAVRRTAGEATPAALARAQWFAVDITEAEAVRQLRGPWDAVINCVSSSRGGAEVYRRVFLEGARHLRQVFASSPPGIYVHLSSTSVYGQTDGAWVTEDSPTEPAGETGRILVAAERLWQEAAGGGLAVTVLRLAGIYGPGRCYWLNQFLSGQARLGEGSRRFLNMVHRDDIVGAILAVLDQRARAAGRVYNVADDCPVTPEVLFGWLAEMTGRPLPPEADGAVVASRKRALTNKRVSNARLKSELGWQPRYPTFREGFLEEIRRLQGQSGGDVKTQSSP